MEVRVPYHASINISSIHKHSTTILEMNITKKISLIYALPSAYCVTMYEPLSVVFLWYKK